MGPQGETNRVSSGSGSKLGLSMLTKYIHSQSDVQSVNIGGGTRIWQYCVILPGARIGMDCNICSHVFIENDVIIGDRVTIKCGVQVWDGVHIEDDVFVGPNVSFTNDLHPRSKSHLSKPLMTRICRGASIGANATILPGLTVGEEAMIGSGAVVTQNVPRSAIVVGNPAKIIGYVNTSIAVDNALLPAAQNLDQPGVSGVSIYNLQHIQDMRGDLCVGELGKNLPFTPRRFFVVSNVPDAKVRGEHAHKKCHQFLICICGSLSLVVDDATNRQEIKLSSALIGVHIEPGIWGVQYKYSPDANLLVFASHEYDPSDYLRDYQDFIDWRKSQDVG